MFHKLRLQFILTNQLIIASLFIILLVGTYLFTSRETQKHPFHFMVQLADHICSGKLNDLAPAADSPGSGTQAFAPPFFVKASSSGEPFFLSSTTPFSPDQTVQLIQLVRSSKFTQGTIDFKEYSFNFLQKPLLNASGALFVFLDQAPEKEGLHMLLGAILLVGLGCLTLSFFGSLFMSRKAIAPIKESWQQQVSFLADAAHELRTPLSIMRVNLDVALSSPDETVAQQKQWLNNVYEEVKQMSKMVEALFFLAHADCHQQPIERKSFNLSSAIDEAILPHCQVALTRNIRIAKKLAENIQMCGDEFRIKQVINILFDNAIRHTNSSGSIAIHLYQSDQHFHIEVTNDGEGIPEQELENIFKRFYQVDKSRSRGGAGLGLSIARWLIEEHGGRITAASQPGNQTTFSITLPK